MCSSVRAAAVAVCCELVICCVSCSWVCFWVCPAGQTQKQTQEQDTQQMTSSQQTATAAALTELHIPYTTQVVVALPEKGFPAYGVLKAGDVITAVDGQPVTSQGALTKLIYAHPAGSTLTLAITR